MQERNLVVAVPAGVEEHLLLLVLLGVQDVVAAKKQSRAAEQRKEGSELSSRQQAASASSIVVSGLPFTAKLHGTHGCLAAELTPVVPACLEILLFLVDSGGGADELT